MTATTPSTALATVQPAFTDSERLALAGFLAGAFGADSGDVGWAQVHFAWRGEGL